MRDPNGGMDIAAYTSGIAGMLAPWSVVAGHLTPILSTIFITFSIAWLIWRMLDRLVHGPINRGRDDE